MRENTVGVNLIRAGGPIKLKRCYTMLRYEKCTPTDIMPGIMAGIKSIRKLLSRVDVQCAVPNIRVIVHRRMIRDRRSYPET